MLNRLYFKEISGDLVITLDLVGILAWIILYMKAYDKHNEFCGFYANVTNYDVIIKENDMWIRLYFWEILHWFGTIFALYLLH